MRLPASIKCCLPFLAFGLAGLIVAACRPSPPTLQQEAANFTEALDANKLPKPTPECSTEKDLLIEMALGLRPTDAAFCQRIGLNEITDKLLPILDEPFHGLQGSAAKEVNGTHAAGRLFLLRGHLLCQQGKIAEGQAWMIKVHRLARRANNDASLFDALTSMGFEGMALRGAAQYVETWSNEHRLAYIQSLSALPPLCSMQKAVSQDNDAAPEKFRIRTIIQESKGLTPTQRKEKLTQLFLPHGMADDYPNLVARYQRLIEGLTVESWDELTQTIGSELEPLTKETLHAFILRHEAALKWIQEEEAKPIDKQNLSTPQARVALYRVIISGPAEQIARYRLDYELRTRLLKSALQRGAAFSEQDLAGLSDAAGKPLRLGTSEEGNRKAIKAGTDVDDFLVVGPIK